MSESQHLNTFILSKTLTLAEDPAKDGCYQARVVLKNFIRPDEVQELAIKEFGAIFEDLGKRCVPGYGFGTCAIPQLIISETEGAETFYGKLVKQSQWAPEMWTSPIKVTLIDHLFVRGSLYLPDHIYRLSFLNSIPGFKRD